jgi:hypothetical protein
VEERARARLHVGGRPSSAWDRSIAWALRSRRAARARRRRRRSISWARTNSPAARSLFRSRSRRSGAQSGQMPCDASSRRGQAVDRGHPPRRRRAGTTRTARADRASAPPSGGGPQDRGQGRVPWPDGSPVGAAVGCARTAAIRPGPSRLRWCGPPKRAWRPLGWARDGVRRAIVRRFGSRADDRGRASSVSSQPERELRRDQLLIGLPAERLGPLYERAGVPDPLQGEGRRAARPLDESAAMPRPLGVGRPRQRAAVRPGHARRRVPAHRGRRVEGVDVPVREIVVSRPPRPVGRTRLRQETLQAFEIPPTF